MASIHLYETKIGQRWKVVFKDENGKQAARCGFESKKEAVKFQKLIEAEAVNNDGKINTKKKEKEMTLSNLVDEYISFGHFEELAEDTRRLHMYKVTIIKNEIGNKTIKQLEDNALTCVQFCNKKAASQKKVYSQLLRRVFEFGKQKLKLTYDLDQIAPPKYAYTCEARSELWTPEQFEQMIQQIYASNVNAGKKRVCETWLRLLAGSGMRFNDPKRMTWEGVNFEEGTALLKQTKVKKNVKNTGRKVWFLNGSIEVLKAWHAECGKPKRGPVFSITDIHDTCESQKKKAGLGHLHFHDLRHTFCTQLINEGVNVGVVSRLAGHSNPTTTLKIYTNIKDIMVNQALVARNEKLDIAKKIA